MDAKQRVGVLGGREPTRGETPTKPMTSGQQRRADREQAALKLWRDWAQEALGPLASEQEDAAAAARRSCSLAALERKCADLAARAQRRLQV
ncbi:uncharacterized protein HaLaN_04708, partial [Haematococcus lacustris]